MFLKTEEWKALPSQKMVMTSSSYGKGEWLVSLIGNLLISWRIDMTKFKVVRYWDTYPDGVIATCDTEEEAEKICNKYRRNRKPMYDYLVRKDGE